MSTRHRISVKIWPDEKRALQWAALKLKFSGMAAMIRCALFHPAEQPAIRQTVREWLPTGGEEKDRTIVVVRLSSPERRELRRARRADQTAADVVRDKLGFYAISPYFRAAALATSRRPRGPVLDETHAANYFRVVAAKARLAALSGRVINPKAP